MITGTEAWSAIGKTNQTNSDKTQTSNPQGNIFAFEMRKSELISAPPEAVRNFSILTQEDSSDALKALQIKQAHDEHRAQIEPIIEGIGLSLGELRKAFADIGMPIVDIPVFTKSAIGTYSVGAWGKGVRTPHPQEKFIEAILNGTAPEFAELSKQVASIIEDLEGMFALTQDFDEALSLKTGAFFVRKESVFEDHFVTGTEHLNVVEDEARKLSWQQPELFEEFKGSLGFDLEDLTHQQLLSRFHYESVIKPNLSERFANYI